MCDALVLADGPAEDDALLGVFGGFFEGDVAQSQRFAGEEAAFGVHAVEDLGRVRMWYYGISLFLMGGRGLTILNPSPSLPIRVFAGMR